MLHPPLDDVRSHHVQFRKSMKKFNAKVKPTFSILDYSTPYAFGRLNNDIVVLLSSLRIPDETFMKKQEEYFAWISEASQDITCAIDFLSSLKRYSLAEKVLLDGIDSPDVSRSIRRLQMQEVKSFRKNDKMRVRMLVQKSRHLYGVCDPFGVLKEGEVFVKVTVGGKGPTSITNTNLLVVRNPCLHPGITNYAHSSCP